MNEMAAKYIFLFNLGTSVLNFGIAIAARVKTQNKEFNRLTLYWASVILAFFMTAILSKTPTQIAFSYFFQIFSLNLIAIIMCTNQNIQFKRRIFYPIQFVGMILSSYLLLKTEIGFTLSLVPVCFSFSLVFIQPIWHSLVTNRKNASWIEKTMGVVFISAIIHIFNFAIFRLDPSAAAWGWAITVAQFQCISVFIPLMINYRRDMKERQNLKIALEQISGKHSQYNLDPEELYRQLEFQIAQKEEIRNQLQTSNQSLEEEREINEILIRTVSHDLANPLTVVNAYVDMLHQGRIPKDESDKIWNRLKTNINSSLDMISRIRNAILTKSQASLVAVHDVSVDRSIKKLTDLFETRLREKNLKLVYKNEVSLDALVLAEETTLTEHVFSNILSNAIKFSFEYNEIHIIVSEDGEHIRVAFKDFGTGIQENRLAKRFLYSTQGTSGEEGSGFGMMVLGYFLRKFGGHLDIKSSTNAADRGTTVSVFLKKSSKNTMTSSRRPLTANLFS